jgi:hypothetical protein
MEDELNILAIDRRFWEGKQTVRVMDVERAHLEVARLEDGTNRAIRNINRRVVANTNRINEVVEELNTNIQILATRMDTWDLGPGFPNIIIKERR